MGVTKNPEWPPGKPTVTLDLRDPAIPHQVIYAHTLRTDGRTIEDRGMNRNSGRIVRSPVHPVCAVHFVPTAHQRSLRPTERSARRGPEGLGAKGDDLDPAARYKQATATILESARRS